MIKFSKKKAKKMICKLNKPGRQQVAEVFYDGPVAVTMVKKARFVGFRKGLSSIVYILANIMLGFILWASWTMITMQEPLPDIPTDSPTTTKKIRYWMSRPTTVEGEQEDTSEPDEVVAKNVATPLPYYAVFAADDVAVKFPMGTLHHSMCTIGFLLFYCSGLMVVTPYFGAAHKMNQSHRRYEHAVLTLFGVFFTAAGTVIYIFSQGIQFKTHSSAGVMTVLLTACSVLTGITTSAVVNGSGIFPLSIRMVHSAFGIGSFLSGLQCQLTGMQMNTYYKSLIMGNSNKINVHAAMNLLLLPAVVIFGALVVLRPVITCVGLNLYYNLKYEPCVCKKGAKLV